MKSLFSCVESEFTHLNTLTESCFQQWEENSCDGHMVTRLSQTCVFSTGKHGHAPWNITNGHLITLCEENGMRERNKIMKADRSHILLTLFGVFLHVLGF